LIVVFVGPDKAGKSTTINILKERFDCPILKAVKMPENEALSTIDDFIQRSTKHSLVLWDRCNYPDDLVYSPVIEGAPSTLEKYRYDIEAKFRKLELLMVYVKAAYDCLYKRYHKDGGDDYVRKVELLKEVIDRYEEFFRQTTIPYVVVDTTYMSEWDAADTVARMIELFKSERRSGRS